MALEIWLARHGETEWSLDGRHTGRTDIPLTAHGEEEAAQLTPRLAGIEFAKVYASPMGRAQKTAALAGFSSPEITDLLSEMDYGEYDGKTSREIHALNPHWELYRDGGPGGETPAHAYARAQRFLALAEGAGQGRVIAFSHGHFLRAVAVAWLDLDIQVARGLQLDVASLSVLKDGDHGKVIARWNT